MNDERDEIRRRLDIVELVSQRVRLKRSGKNYLGLCPFHDDKTPSFNVSPTTGRYKCFACGESGDVFTWVMKTQALEFREALKVLADQAGVVLSKSFEGPRIDKSEREAQLAIMQSALIFFRNELRRNTAALAYLDGRSIDQAVQEDWEIGYAPDVGEALAINLQKEGKHLATAEQLFLTQKDRSGGFSDKFRGRVMFPIRDERGDIVGFGGRILGDGHPKYINSSETPLYNKSRVLYGIHRAKDPMMKSRHAVLVEGYLDVIACHRAGVTEAVASCGTALAEGQVKLLKRFADKVTILYDGDSAGQKAAIRAANRALPMLAPGRSLAFVTLPAGVDPDDFVRAKGPAAFAALLEKPEPLVDRLWAHELAAEPLDTPEQKAGLKQRYTGLAQAITDADVRTQYLAEFNRRFDALYARVRAPFVPFERAKRKPGQKWKAPDIPVTDGAKGVRAGGIDRILAKAVLAGLIRHPAEIARHMEVLGALKLADGALGRLFEAVIDLAVEDQALDSERLLTILAKSGFDIMATDLLRADQLSCSFTQKDAEPARAREDLDEAIAILVARPEVDAALAEATTALMAGYTDEAFQRQVSLVKEQQALDARLANLVQANEDARAFSAEGN